MYKYSSKFFLFAVVLLFSAPCWAQRVLPPMPKPSQIAAAHRAGVYATTRQATRISTAPLKNIPINLLMSSPDAIAIRIERQRAFLILNKILMEKAEALKAAAAASKLENEKAIAATTPIGQTNITSQPGAIMFRGVKLDDLHPGEMVIMGSGYNPEGFQVASIQFYYPNGNPITIDRMERAIRAYDISRVILAVRIPPTENTPRKIRLIDYDLASGNTKITVK